MVENSSNAQAISQLVTDEGARRRFLKHLGIAGLGAASIGLMTKSENVFAQSTVTDVDVLNFALNLEYLEAEFYTRAAFGRGLNASDTTGVGTRGTVTGGRQVTFGTNAIRQYADEIAADEEAHVRFLRAALGSAAVAEPTIDIQNSFTAAARAAGIIGATQTFDPYADENSFLVAAFIFEDVGVTAYKGAAPLLTNKDFLSAAAGILAVEAYHASNIRTVLIQRGLTDPPNKISNLRATLGGGKDQGVTPSFPPNTVAGDQLNLVPSDANALAFGRTPREVLNIVYGQVNASAGLFFPQGVNGTIRS